MSALRDPRTALGRWRAGISVSDLVRQDAAARRLDMETRHLGALTIAQSDTDCAVCGGDVRAGTTAIQSLSTHALSHVACGELHGGRR